MKLSPQNMVGSGRASSSAFEIRGGNPSVCTTCRGKRPASPSFVQGRVSPMMGRPLSRGSTHISTLRLGSGSSLQLSRLQSSTASSRSTDVLSSGKTELGGGAEVESSMRRIQSAATEVSIESQDEPGSFRAFFLGSASIDRVRIHSDLAVIPDAKAESEHKFDDLGGGGVNAAIALRELAKIYNLPCELTLCTKIGAVETMTQPLVKERLQAIDVIDIADDQYKLPDNTIISFAGGRFISTSFKSAEVEPTREKMEEVLAAAKRADCIVLHSRYPKEALEIAKMAKLHGIQTILDYSCSDPNNIGDHHLPLAHVDFVVCPEESVLPGMTKENPEQLKELMVNTMGVKNLAISGGSKPTYAKFGDEERLISVDKADHVVDTLGTGDLRNAGFALFLAKKDDPFLALEKASKISSFSVQYPGRSWLPELEALVEKGEGVGAFTSMAAANDVGDLKLDNLDTDKKDGSSMR